MSYSVYKQFGRVIGQKEWDATLKLALASWYEKPYYKFIIWLEKCKRWIKAEVRLSDDNPFKGCLYEIIFGFIFGLFIFGIIDLIKIIINII